MEQLWTADIISGERVGVGEGGECQDGRYLFICIVIWNNFILSEIKI